MHVHCREFSSCGQADGEEMIQAAIRHGMDALVWANHWRLVPESVLDSWNWKYSPFRYFNGLEVQAEAEDFVIVGVNDPALEKSGGWSYERFHDFVGERGGGMILAHPYRYYDSINVSLADRPPAAIECRSCNMKEEHHERVLRLAEALGVPVVCSSDAHDLNAVGEWYTEFPSPVESEPALARRLHEGAFTIGYLVAGPRD